MLTLPDLDHLIALYEEWLRNPPPDAGTMHADTMRERLNHLRARRNELLDAINSLPTAA